MKHKIVLLGALFLGMFSLYACKTSAPAAKLPAGTLVLDKWRSSLGATVIKNETVAVQLKFPDIDGTLSVMPLHATVSCNIEKLDSGNPDRDKNVREAFFETTFSAFKTARFDLTSVEGNVSGMAQGESQFLKAKGVLELHGNKVPLSGPLNISRGSDGSYSASFKDTWVVDIKEAGMLGQLANLAKICPQPHRVGYAVKLQGELIFMQP